METFSLTTFRGKLFKYTGDIASHLIVFTGKSALAIDKQIIDYVKILIENHDEIKMGACRDNPSSNSLGMYLRQIKKSPQLLSYILPLLEANGFLTHRFVNNTIYVKRLRQPK